MLHQCWCASGALPRADSLNVFWAPSFPRAPLASAEVLVSGTSLTSQSTSPDKTRATAGRTLIAHHPGALTWARRWAREGAGTMAQLFQVGDRVQTTRPRAD